MTDFIYYPIENNNHSASCERVAGRPTAAILDAPADLSMTRDGTFAGGQDVELAPCNSCVFASLPDLSMISLRLFDSSREI